MISLSLDPQMVKWSVLIVDDEPDNIGVASKVLSFNGVLVYTATNGIEALEYVKKINNLTFILLDLSMPKMDGWETIKHLRADPVLRKIPVIALTAHAMAGDREKALEAGFDWYITKPFTIRTFLGEIKECLRHLNLNTVSTQ